MKRYGDISTTMVSLLKSLHRFGKTSRAAGRVIPQPQPTRPSRRQRNIRLPLEVNKKTAGKLPAVSGGRTTTALSPTKLFQRCPKAPQAGRLEVVVFYRAGAVAVAAANG